MASHKYIENVLEKYFEATTTVAEESELRAYFAQEDVAAHLEQYRSMFTYFSIAKEESYPTKEPLKPSRKLNFRWLSIAAATILFFGIYFGNQYWEQRQAEIAYQETKEALNLLAENFNKGTQKMGYLNELEIAKQKLYNEN
ncbi:hypothetical protein GCM10011414_16410 [Croceivirga lutea]|uniref:hypothetical protein n=1 Tax=Croceivirga lutea TaxID=1775167 RepID=UPI001639E75A|nr:hypothetical protein [Croceivirga lutea]GGG47440.1 hypothetical protein GCM10011414_16410 [Croceivirga lutea]